jgi:avermectin B 5-O-methyltransferase
MPVNDPVSAEAVRDLYDDLTDVMAQTMGGCLHGACFGGPHGAPTLEEGADKLTDLVVERCRLVAGQRVLDVGSGNGKATCRVAATHRVRVSGVTLSGHQVQLSRTLADDLGLAGTVDFRVADMCDLPFPDGAFDAAFAIESFCHVDDRVAAFREIGRVLRAGGTLAAADVVLRRPIERSEDRAAVAANSANFKNGPILPQADYAAAIRSAGLEPVDFTDIGDEVWPSFAAVAANMRESPGAAARYGADPEFRNLVDALERFATVPELGYVVLVARKPTASR